MYHEANACDEPTSCSELHDALCCILPEGCHDETLLIEYFRCLIKEEGDCNSDLSCSSGSEATRSSSGAASVTFEGGLKMKYAVSVALGAAAVGAMGYLQ